MTVNSTKLNAPLCGKQRQIVLPDNAVNAANAPNADNAASKVAPPVNVVPVNVEALEEPVVLTVWLNLIKMEMVSSTKPSALPLEQPCEPILLPTLGL